MAGWLGKPLKDMALAVAGLLMRENIVNTAEGIVISVLDVISYILFGKVLRMSLQGGSKALHLLKWLGVSEFKYRNSIRVLNKYGGRYPIFDVIIIMVFAHAGNVQLLFLPSSRGGGYIEFDFDIALK
ncbi:hypothetical protein NEUTE2DRAFT_139391 [Neurospora tetrasperma FGSC 2509]|nr:hypothetical protein NEUTE2DRAFT_139391 [Neurospora tetrasperma FGSC 2509]